MVLPNDNEGFPHLKTSDLATVLAGLRAAGEGTRLRILAILDQGELTVSELCRILGQTQPRVSRHLKLLCDAQLLDRHSEGTSAFYAPTRIEPGRSILRSVLSLIAPDDPMTAADRQRLDAIRNERAVAAGHYFEQIAGLWDGIRSLHVADAEVEQALLNAADKHRIDGKKITSLLDIGTGTGRILELFADRIERGLGIDLSKAMLNLARTNLINSGLHHCSVRHGNIYALDVEPGSFDLAVLHHVLHFLDDPKMAITAAVKGLAPGGQLIVVDFAPHQLESLRTEHAHRRLGFDESEVAQWFLESGLEHVTANHLVPSNPSPEVPGAERPEEDEQNLLTVSLWTATQPTAKPQLAATSPQVESI